MLTRGLYNRLFSPRGLVSIGLIATLLGLWGFRDEWGFVSRVTLVEAEITAVREMMDRGDIPSLAVTLRYDTVEGPRTAEAAPTTRALAAGTRITAGYDPANPDDVRVMSPLDNWLIPAWVILVGVSAIVFGFVRFRQTGRWLSAS